MEAEAAAAALAVEIEVEEGLGFVQRCSYRHPDLYHEDVLEIDSPWAAVSAAGVQSFHFLLMGDQNAGKSSFLHCFTNDGDPGFIELASLLPILHSSFSNTRYLDPACTALHMAGSVRPARSAAEVLATPFAMDEPPFLDTDLGSGSLLVTKENFEFFLYECNLVPGKKVMTKKLLSALSYEEEEALNVPLLDEGTFSGLYDDPEDTRYVLLQFQEIGGDLLDLLMLSDEEVRTAHENILTSQHMRTRLHVREKARTWLSTARKTVYFVNASSLFDVTPSVSVSHERIRLLVERMRFLDKTFPQGHEVLLHVSRMPYSLPEDDVCDLVNALSDVLFSETGLKNTWRDSARASQPPPTGIQFSEESPPPPSGARWALSSLLQCFLERMAARENWQLRFILPHAMSHLDSSGAICPAAIMQTLVALFEHGMVNSRGAYDDSVARQIIRAAARLGLQEWSGDNHSGHVVEWLDVTRFHEELVEEEHCDDGEVPQHSALAAFGRVTDRLFVLGLCITEKSSSNILIEFTAGGATYLWQPSSSRSAEQPSARLPQYVPEVVPVIEGLLARNIPLVMWNRADTVVQSVVARAILLKSHQKLKDLLAGTVLKLLDGPAREGLLTVLKLEILYILEEFLFVTQLLEDVTEAALIGVQCSCDAKSLQQRIPCVVEPQEQYPSVRILLQC